MIRVLARGRLFKAKKRQAKLPNGVAARGTDPRERVAPGPIWTANRGAASEQKYQNFGYTNVFGRSGQPAALPSAKTGEEISPHPTALRVVRRDHPPIASAVERLSTNPLMAATNIAYQAPERRRLLFRRIVRDIVFGMLPPVATIILVVLVVLVFGR